CRPKSGKQLPKIWWTARALFIQMEPSPHVGLPYITAAKRRAMIIFITPSRGCVETGRKPTRLGTSMRVKHEDRNRKRNTVYKSASLVDSSVVSRLINQQNGPKQSSREGQCLRGMSCAGDSARHWRQVVQPTNISVV